MIPVCRTIGKYWNPYQGSLCFRTKKLYAKLFWKSSMIVLAFLALFNTVDHVRSYVQSQKMQWPLNTLSHRLSLCVQNTQMVLYWLLQMGPASHNSKLITEQNRSLLQSGRKVVLLTSFLIRNVYWDSNSN